jgi:galactose mutarotase-like enzyme
MRALPDWPPDLCDNGVGRVSMAKREQNMFDTQTSTWISLSSAELSAQINPLGAQLSVLRDSEGLDLLWNGEPSIWAGRAPLLFPTVGTLAGGRYRVGSGTYQLPRHGFARGKPFETLEAGTSRALFRLQADAETLKVYPFQFQLDVSFALSGATLTVKSSVRNVGQEDLPASIGYHPGFRWPLPYGADRATHVIEFAHEEGPSIRRLDSSGLLTSVRHPTPVTHRRLLLDDSLFRDDVVIFDEVRSRSVTYGGDTGRRLRVSFPDARYLGLWTKPGAPFVCIEPWQGIADEAGFTGDFKEKLGVFTLTPGATRSLTMEITLLP